jgi:hypothetical protein
MYLSPFCTRWSYYPIKYICHSFAIDVSLTQSKYIDTTLFQFLSYSSTHLAHYFVSFFHSFFHNSLSNIHDSLYFIFHSLGDWVKEESNPALKLAIGTNILHKFSGFFINNKPLNLLTPKEAVKSSQVLSP